MSKSKVTWTDTGMGLVGHVTIADGNVKIASISRSVKRNDPKPWVLRTEIPGWTNARHHDTVESAQASVDHILRSFVTALREPFPEMSQVRMAAENAHESGYPDAAFGDFLHGFQCGAKWMGVGR